MADDELTIEECLEAIVEKDQEIERLHSLVVTLKSASNDLRACLGDFADAESWRTLIVGTAEEEAEPEWEWKRQNPLLLARRTLLCYSESLKAWDDAHPNGAERLRLR